MTRNQIEFHKMMETRRANRATEEITRTRDERAHTVALGQLSELSRHNFESEKLTQRSLDETSRHNLETESHARSVLAEQQRHSMAVEAETYRSNVAHEIELNRSNLAKEAETHRSNVAREGETKRSNLAAEALRSQELAEQARYHTASINLGYANLAETSRSNKTKEAEIMRSNMTQEIERNRSNLAQEALEDARIAETVKHNRATERSKAVELSKRQQEIDLLKSRTGSENVRRGFQNARDVFGMLKDVSSEARQWINMR